MASDRTSQTADNQGHPATQTLTNGTGSRSEWAVTDAAGSPVAHTDLRPTTGSGSASATLDQLAEDTDTGTQEFATTGWDGTEPGYTGQQSDPTAGLTVFHARALDNTAAVFAGHDKWAGHLRDPQTRNHYAYVLNNPATLKDHLGYDPIQISPTGQVTDWNAISPASYGYADNWYDPAPVVDYGSGPADPPVTDWYDPTPTYTPSYTPTTDYGGSSYSTDNGYTNYTPTNYITPPPTQTPTAASQYQIPTTHLTQWGGGDSSSGCGPEYNPCSSAEYRHWQADMAQAGSNFEQGIYNHFGTWSRTSTTLGHISTATAFFGLATSGVPYVGAGLRATSIVTGAASTTIACFVPEGSTKRAGQAISDSCGMGVANLIAGGSASVYKRMVGNLVKNGALDESNSDNNVANLPSDLLQLFSGVFGWNL